MPWFVDSDGKCHELRSLSDWQYEIVEHEGWTEICIGRRHEDGFEVDDSYVLHSDKPVDCTTLQRGDVVFWRRKGGSSFIARPAKIIRVTAARAYIGPRRYVEKATGLIRPRYLDYVERVVLVERSRSDAER